MAVRQKMGMKMRAGTDPKQEQGHLGYEGDSGLENATRNSNQPSWEEEIVSKLSRVP